MENNILKIINNSTEKIKLNYFNKGSYGIILKLNEKYICKLTILNNGIDIISNNLIEMFYLNYFKLNYELLYNNKDNFYPIQNQLTKIYTYEELTNKFLFDSQTYECFFEFGINNINNFLILNFMENNGISINKQLLKDKHIMYDNYEIIFKNIINGLYMIHCNDLLHGDLKSSNILYNEKICKIIDLGGIKSIYEDEYRCTCTNTYRCPEEFNYDYGGLKFKNNSFKTDIWSLGILFLEILSNNNPVHNYYMKLYRSGKNNDDIDNELNKIFKRKTFTEEIIKNEIKKNNYISDDYKLNKLSKIIYEMLTIDVDKRIGNLSDIYFNIFNESITTPFNTHTCFNYNIENNVNNIGYKLFRQNNFKIIVDILNFFKHSYAIPLAINIIDKYFITQINNNQIEVINNIISENDDYKEYNILLYLAVIIISIIIIYQNDIDNLKFISIINNSNLLKFNLTTGKLTLIFYNISNICELLNYDIINNNLDFKNIKEPLSIDKLNIIIDDIIKFNIDKLY